ncbi:ChbG/HpnK family deacetylase [uncultured Comamonas sp.]|uniref:ChbG/HpnK family deacetylase n=1 Tax=uncultured Comamonas sp. TaxID=114710 RepID=UPI003749ECCC
MKNITLCADDFALHPAVDAAVLELAALGRLSATSCMTTAPGWRAAARALPAVRSQLDLGLHFNLTEGHRIAPDTPITRILSQAYTARLSAAALRDAWRRQLDAFEDALGMPPVYVDGHQHVHQLPGVRKAMLAELSARYGAAARQIWIRSTAPAGALRWQAKSATIALLGGYRLSHQLQRQHWATNQGFAGVYGFDAPTEAAYGGLMAQWLAECQDGSLLMCHPAQTPMPEDAIGQQRPVEWAYLRSPAFGALLAAQGCRIGKLAPAKPASAAITDR